MSFAAHGLSLLAGALTGTVAVSVLARGAPVIARAIDSLIEGAAGLIGKTILPLRRAGSHGRDPSDVERRRLRVAGGLLGGCCGWVIAGGWLALGAGLAGALWPPRVAVWRRERYGRRVEAGVASAALSISGALSGGGSIRAAIGSAAHELEGPIAIELRRTAVELGAGASMDAALDGLVARAPSRSILRIAAAIQLQRRSGGDLASLLRRIAASLEDERRATEEANAATAQARVTSFMVLALPPAGMALAELASPGLLGRMLGSQPGASLVILAAGFQAAGALAVRRLARIGP
jgi:tight adherence protein B